MKRLLTVLVAAALCSACSDEGNNENPSPNPPDVETGEVTYSDITADYEPLACRSSKRGVSFNLTNLEDIDLMGDKISWYYNWGPDASYAPADEALTAKGVDFFPMAWNGSFSASRIRAYKQAHPECEYILGFNEPNLTDQAHMTPQQAAEAWVSLRELAQELGMKIIAPAMNYGTLSGYSDPIKWLDEFFQLVPISDVSGIAIHCYMGSAQSMKSYVQRFYKYNLPIWMTEFCAWEQNIGSPADQMRFMSEALHYLEADPKVERYAWFIPRGSVPEQAYPHYALLTSTKPVELTDLGVTFINFPILGNSESFNLGEVIPAEAYFATHADEKATTSEWVRLPYLRPTEDEGGILDVYSISKGHYLDYNLSLNGKASRLYLRYGAYIDSEVIVTAGDTSYSIALPATGEDNIFKTAILTCEIPASAKTLRVECNKGNFSLNWMMIRK